MTAPNQPVPALPPGAPDSFHFNITPEFGAALAAFQKELPKIERNKHVEVATKKDDADDYDYWYADLEEVSRGVLPALARHGLSFSSYPGVSSVGRGLSLRYFLLHDGGGYILAEWPIIGTDAKGIRAMQNIGGMITFIRRYALQAATGVATDTDDDLQAAAKKEEGGQDPAVARRQRSAAAREQQAADNTARRNVQARQAASEPAPEPESEREPEEMHPPSDPDAPLTRYPQMQKKLIVQFRQMEIVDRDKRLLALSTLLGRDITTQNELTAGEGFELIGAIEPLLAEAETPQQARQMLRELAEARAQETPSADEPS
jgi:hypothetical protein